MVDLTSVLPLLTDEQRVQIESAFSLVVLKILVSEVAAINRTPREANDYLVKLKEKIGRIVENFGSDDTVYQKQWNREMYLLNAELFQGISFQAVKK